MMLEAGGLSVPLEMPSEAFLDALTPHFTRYAIGKNLLQISPTNLRNIHLRGGATVKIDENYVATVSRTLIY